MTGELTDGTIACDDDKENCQQVAVCSSIQQRSELIRGCISAADDLMILEQN